MKPSVVFQICQLLLFTSFLFDLIICPHSKVEESFQLQATHDLFYHGIRPALYASLSNDEDDNNISNLPYDRKFALIFISCVICFVLELLTNIELLLHKDLQFPGVVPRTFCGPIILAFLCQSTRFILLPVIDIAIHPMFVQFLARFFLLTFLAHGWVRLARVLYKQKQDLACWFLLITACQFHMPYYASRMLPNIFALGFILHSFVAWIQGKIRIAVIWMVFATVVFRCDLLLLLGSCGIYWVFVSKKLPIVEAVKIGIITALCSLLLTVPLDCIMWQRLVWPEGQVFYYNTVLGKSSNWGTSPWYWYFLSALPKSMLLTLILVPLSSLRIVEYLCTIEQRLTQKKNENNSLMKVSSLIDTQWLEYLIPTMSFVVLYSFLGHKEMRFIFPALPILNVTAAAGLSRLTNLAFPPKKGKKVPLIALLAFGCGVLCLILTLVGSLVFVAVSRWNYPGGNALPRLMELVQDGGHRSTDSSTVNVYIDVASSMSGISLFGQRAVEASTPEKEWSFVKGGYEQENQLVDGSLNSFTYILTEEPNISAEYHVISTIQGNPRLDLKHATIATNDAIYILERIKN